jgi:ribosomal protein S6--L-glutamate ligase
MILSYHPCYAADRNLICAGRMPGRSDLLEIQAAKAVILPQGCSRQLYDMASKNCTHVFPCQDAKFEYPGKIGQIRLFKKFKIPHPKTFLFNSMTDFKLAQDKNNDDTPLRFPFVLKLNWGGEGEGVFLIDSKNKMQLALKKVAAFESSGQKGFLIQKFIDCDNRSLRVVIIGDRLISYWRVQEDENRFHSHISKGAVIDYTSNSDLQYTGQKAVMNLCEKTGINLAGFDLLFKKNGNYKKKPFFLEINYFFGRKGLGGSEKYYEILTDQIQKWIDKLSVKR